MLLASTLIKNSFIKDKIFGETVILVINIFLIFKDEYVWEMFISNCCVILIFLKKKTNLVSWGMLLACGIVLIFGCMIPWEHNVARYPLF
jgi:hypothetical protein